MRRPRSMMVMGLVLALGGAGVARAATPEQIQTAIDRGLAWLLSQQQPNGSWNTGFYPAGSAGICLAVLGHHAQQLRTTPLATNYPHRAQMQAGLNFIFSQAYHGSGRVWFGHADFNSAQNYHAGPCLMAIVLSGESNRVVNVPGSPVNGLTYRQVAERIVNQIALTQNTTDVGIGSWFYYPSQPYGDVSVSGWTTLGLGYARDRFEILLPATMMTRVSSGIDLMQQTSNPASPDYGGAGYRSTYTPPYSYWVNTHKTGHLLYMMHLVGETTNSVRVQRAIDYLRRHWSSPTSGDFTTSGWRGNPPALFPSYIATATIMKGLVALEVEELAGGIDWYDDLATVIVNNQNAAGYWAQDGHPGRTANVWPLSTAWALLTLMRATPLDPVQAAWENILYTSADYRVTSGLGGTGYYILVPRDAPPPTEAQVKAGVNYGAVTVVTSGSGPVTAGVERVFSVSGLTADTAYDHYFVVQAPDNSYGLLVKTPLRTKAYTVPEVDQTTEANNIQPNSAASGGNVSDSGGQPVTQRGIVWSTSPLPTLASHVGGAITTNGVGIGSFVSLLTGLVPDTKYYVRAYAVNVIGEGYGPSISFNTEPKLVKLLGGSLFLYGWYARFSEYRLRCRFQFEKDLQPAGGPLEMRTLRLDTPPPMSNTFVIYSHTNQSVYGSNVLFELVSQTGYGDDIPSDGEYTLHLEYADMSSTQTVFRFFVPGTTNPLPEPEQFPVIFEPVQGSSLVSPVDFEWSAVTDSNVTSVTLEMAGLFFQLPRDWTQYGPIELPLGDQSFEVWFLQGFGGLYTVEGVQYQIGKGNSKVHTFDVFNDSVFTQRYLKSFGGHLDGVTTQVVMYGHDGSPVEAVPELDALFGGWTDSSTDNPRTELYVTNNLTVTAWFKSPAGVPLTWYEDYELLPGPGETWADVDAGDADSDLSSNADEYYAGSNPRDGTDFLRIDDFMRFPAAIVEFQSSTTRLYRLQTSYDPVAGDWFDIPGEDFRPGVGGDDALVDPYPPNYDHFYRIEVQRP